jgi:hypothetical protein
MNFDEAKLLSQQIANERACRVYLIGATQEILPMTQKDMQAFDISLSQEPNSVLGFWEYGEWVQVRK